MNAVPILITPELFAPAESSHFEGKLDAFRLVVGADDYEFVSDLPWMVDITNTGDALLVMGSVTGQATTACARCLDKISLTLQGDIEGYFLIDESQEAPEDMDDDEFDVLPENHELDLAPLIEAALVVAMPQVPLCSKDCKGICPVCGANLNNGPCSCENDKKIYPLNPFAALQNFNFDE